MSYVASESPDSASTTYNSFAATLPSEYVEPSSSRSGRSPSPSKTNAEEQPQQTWTNEGPLTTMFTPPPGCPGYSYFGANEVIRDSLRWECYPPMTAGYHAYFSPAVCPSGWFSAADVASLWNRASAVPTIAPFESAALCCPSGYKAVSSLQGADQLAICESVLTAPLSDVTSLHGAGFSMTVLPATISGKPITAVETRPVYVRWQSSDLSVLQITQPPSSSPSPSSQSSPPGPETAGANGNPPSDPGSFSTGSDGLSTGAKAGIGAGVGIGVAVLGLIFFLFFRAWKRRSDPASAANHNKWHDRSDSKLELPCEAHAGELPAGDCDAENYGHYQPPAPRSAAPAPLGSWGARQYGTSSPTETAELDASTTATYTPALAAATLVRNADPSPNAPSHPSPSSATVIPSAGTSLNHSPRMEAYAPLAPKSGRSSPEATSELARLEQEDRRISARRAAIQEAMNLMEEERKLEIAQQAVQRRLQELRVPPP